MVVLSCSMAAMTFFRASSACAADAPAGAAPSTRGGHVLHRHEDVHFQVGALELLGGGPGVEAVGDVILLRRRGLLQLTERDVMVGQHQSARADERSRSPVFQPNARQPQVVEPRRRRREPVLLAQLRRAADCRTSTSPRPPRPRNSNTASTETASSRAVNVKARADLTIGISFKPRHALKGVLRPRIRAGDGLRPSGQVKMISLMTMPLIEPGTKAPAFSLKDQAGKTHRLADYEGRPIVLYFYPKDDTPGCTKEACAFRDNCRASRPTKPSSSA